jgi:DNA-binding transcriptional LysR family regulator
VRPTHAGESFFALAREALDCLDLGAANAAAAGRGARGRLTLGPASSFSAGRLHEALTRYRASHPSVDLQFIEGERSQMIEGLHRRTVDVAILIGDPGPGVGEPLPLWCERVYAALPKDHVLARRASVSWGELDAEAFLTTLQGCGADRARLAGARHARPGKAGLIQSYPVSLETLLSMVGLGLGVSLITESDLGRGPDTVAAIPLTEDAGAVSVPLTAYRDPKNDNPALRRFWSLLKGRYSPGRPALRSPSEG